MTQLVAQAQVSLAEAEHTLMRLGEHMREHGFEFQRDGADWKLAIHGGLIHIRVDGEQLDIRAEAATMDALYDLKAVVASHLLEFSSQAVEIRWYGDGSQLREPPAFRVLRVIAARDLTARMRRITLAGERLERYAGLGNLHCKLLLPQPGNTEPEWPTLDANGLLRMPEGDKRLDMRTYTIRDIDPAAGTLEIDMVVHEPAGPGGSWAQRARPGDRVIEEGQPVVVDMGCVLDGYCSDMTRTFCLGEPSAHYLEVWQIVLRAQEAALHSVRAGLSGVAADAAARDVIEAAGYGEQFGHGTGHGVGLAVHEKPRAGRLSEDTLQAGMSLTLEPGIYLPGQFGVRIEDLVIVREDGIENLTGSPKAPVLG